jgi:hypothetical protein
VRDACEGTVLALDEHAAVDQHLDEKARLPGDRIRGTAKTSRFPDVR